MNTETDQLGPSVEQIKQKIEDYRTTIHALQCLVSLLTWDNENDQRLPNTHASFGRRMVTSPSNRISPETRVTPDAVIQRSADCGYLVEAKKSLPNNSERWRKVVRQLEKYDDDLLGWWTDNEKLDSSCVVLLIHITRVAEFTQYLQQIVSQEEISFIHPLSLVEFTRSTEWREFLFLRKHWGRIDTEEIAGALSSGKSVPVEDVIGSYGEKKFYDSQPITEYMMSILWQVIFNERKSDSEYDEQEKAWLIDVGIDELATDLQRLYGSTGSEQREVRYPKNKWVRDAMDAFVKIKLATSSDDDQGYVVRFKRLTGDIIERFAKHRSASLGEEDDSDYDQLSLI